MVAARPVAALAAHVPLRDRPRGDVVIDRMAAVASRAGGTLRVVRRIERRPPVRARADEIRRPFAVHDIPLRAEREVVFADLLEITLLPLTPVDEGNVLAPEFYDCRIGLRKVGNDGVRMLARISHHVRHAGSAPALVDRAMASLARRRSDVSSRLQFRGTHQRHECDAQHSPSP